MYKESIASEEVGLNLLFLLKLPTILHFEISVNGRMETLHSMKNGFSSKVASKGIVLIFAYNS